jgi:hypothetical protein
MSRDPSTEKIQSIILSSRHKAARWLRYAGHIYYWRAEDGVHSEGAAIIGGLEEKGIVVIESGDSSRDT